MHTVHRYLAHYLYNYPALLDSPRSLYGLGLSTNSMNELLHQIYESNLYKQTRTLSLTPTKRSPSDGCEDVDARSGLAAYFGLRSRTRAAAHAAHAHRAGSAQLGERERRIDRTTQRRRWIPWQKHPLLGSALLFALLAAVLYYLLLFVPH